MAEVKERIVDLGFEDTELREESEIEEEDTQLVYFPHIRPFFTPWLWPIY
ncbi:MAG: hypothetical protein ACFFHV_07790 [Promethearchaeota archaeon]